MLSQPYSECFEGDDKFSTLGTATAHGRRHKIEKRVNYERRPTSNPGNHMIDRIVIDYAFVTVTVLHLDGDRGIRLFPQSGIFSKR